MFKSWILLCFFVLGRATAHGQDQASSSLRLGQGEERSPSKLSDHLKMGLGLSFSSYFRQRTEPLHGAETVLEISDLTLVWNYSWHGVLDGAIDLTNRYALQEKANYLMPKNFYVGHKGRKWDLWFGRKWYKWSEADEHLSRGLYQGRFMNDKFHKDSHGFTGVFVENKWQGGSWVVFASPLYIPEFGPNYELIDGNVYSLNPYFLSPPDTIDLFGVRTRLRYNIVEPAVTEIVFNESFATLLEHSWGNWFLRGSYAYKPMNQLLLIGEAWIQLLEEGPQDIHANIHPRIQYHHLSTIEGGWQRRGGWNNWLSFTYERPEQDELPREWIQQMTGETGVLTASIGYDLFSGPWGVTYLYTSSSRVAGGDRPDSGGLGTHSTLFEGRYQFLETIELGLNGGHFLLRGENFTWGARGIYDLVQQGGVLSVDAKWGWGPQWEVWSRVDLIGIVAPKWAQLSGGFLESYEANDRVQLGMNYVF